MARKKTITHGSTFSGIGAPEVAAEMLGWKNVFHCEINPFGRGVLDYYFKDSESYEDITKQDFSRWRGKITVLTGGFPCQPFSYAGKRRGSEDDRYLWPFMLKCIQEVRPTWFVGENVAGITTMVFPGEDVKVGSGATLFDQTDYIRRDERYVIEEICQQLEDCGYSVQPMLIPACAVGAPHRRDRVFFIAHRNDDVEDTMHSGLMGREHDEQGSERNIGDACARGAERICGEEGTEMRPTPHPSCSGSGAQEPCGGTESNGSDGYAQPSQRRQPSQRTDGLSAVQGTDTHPDSHRGREVHQPLQPQLADGTEPISNGRKSDVADTRCTELQAGLDERSNGITDRETSGRSGRGDSECDATNTNSIGGQTQDIWRESEQRGEDCKDNEQPQSVLNQGGWAFTEQDIRRLMPESRWRTFPTVSPVYRGNDGLPFDVDNLTIPFSRWKKESLKAYGNAIVVQVMYELFRAIEMIENKEYYESINNSNKDE